MLAESLMLTSFTGCYVSPEMQPVCVWGNNMKCKPNANTVWSIDVYVLLFKHKHQK